MVHLPHHTNTLRPPHRDRATIVGICLSSARPRSRFVARGRLGVRSPADLIAPSLLQIPTTRSPHNPTECPSYMPSTAATAATAPTAPTAPTAARSATMTSLTTAPCHPKTSGSGKIGNRRAGRPSLRRSARHSASTLQPGCPVPFMARGCCVTDHALRVSGRAGGLRRPPAPRCGFTCRPLSRADTKSGQNGHRPLPLKSSPLAASTTLSADVCSWDNTRSFAAPVHPDASALASFLQRRHP